MPDAAERPLLDPDAIAGHAFTRSRKGYEADEVRAFLVSLASQVREAQQRRADLERRLAELERRAVDPKDLDEAAVTQLLGEETARVLETARTAANDIRSRAEETAKARTDEADDQATATRSAADQYADGVRSSADEAAARTKADADQYAEATRSTADAETTAQRASADEYSGAIRDAADEEVAALRATATAEIDRVRSEADSVLADRTAEAEVRATAIVSEADGYDGRTREDADRYAEATRAAADSYRADVQSAADAYRDAATSEGDRLRSEALADAEGTRAAADADAVARREAGEAEVEQLLADAREQGRSMVQEARTYRERVIADLADRRRGARAQLEQLAATRDALAVTLTDVASRIDSSHRSLQDAVIDPRDVGDIAQDRRTLEAADLPETATAVAVGEIDGPAALDEADGDGPDGEDGGADHDHEADLEGGEPDGEPAEEAVAVEVDVADADADADAAGEPEPADGPADAEPAPAEPDAGAEPDDAELEAVAQAEGPDQVDIEVEPPAVDDEPETEVDDLFARIRADREEAEAEAAASAPATEVEGEGGAGDEPEAATEAGRGDGEGDAAVDVEVAEKDDADPDTDLLDLRDATTDEIERQLARRLKRVLSDEQNEVLDLLRRTRGTPGAAEVLPTEDEHLARYTSAALEDLTAAERAGAGFYGDAPRRTADVRDVGSEFAATMVRQIRARLERAFDDGGDENEVGERIRACYREWKTQRIADTARHYVIAAFSRGVAEAAPDGSSFRWLVDHGDAAAPDCHDNALAGPVRKGETFPTGDLCPPVHPGCRCLLVLVDAT